MYVTGEGGWSSACLSSKCFDRQLNHGGLRMKVVIFCGGLGMRIRADHQSLPKPMVPIGSRPVLWHVMRYYAHFGHTDFILCLGYGAEAVKEYFLDYRETTSNDFVLRKGGEHIDLLKTDISEWNISFIDTGIDTPIGERLRRVRPHLEDDEIFLANYGDVLTDAPMNDLISEFIRSRSVAQLLAVKPQDSFHVVEISGQNMVTGLTPVGTMSMRINGGYFVLRQGIFDYLEEGEDLVMDAYPRAAADGRLRAVLYDGFWAPMDTVKEHTALEDMYRRGISPWALWRDRLVREIPPIVPVPDIEPAL
jgi:glucose-1-phosphate cytidylyltransferase